jgi:hypothetical protein
MTDVRTALRWGAWVFGGMTLLVFYRSAALDTAVRFGHPDVQRAAYLTSVGAWAATICLLPDGGFWLRLRPGLRVRLRRLITGVLLVLTLGAAGAATLTVPAGQQHTETSWAVATNGWVLLAISSGRNTAMVVSWLAAPMVFAMVAAAAGGISATVLMTARTLGILGLQVPVAVAMRALERSADAATALRLKQEAIRTDRVVADALHHDRLRRSQAVAIVIEPVLAVLAEQTADANPDDTLRRRCGVAAAQVRRLLAEWHRNGPDPLGDDLTACLDQVQAAGLRVDVAVHATPHAELPAPLRRVACDVIRALACDLRTRLRVTVLATTTHLCVSIVASTAGAADDGHARRRLATVSAPLTIRTTIVGDSIWVELTCPL